MKFIVKGTRKNIQSGGADMAKISQKRLDSSSSTSSSLSPPPRLR